MFELLKLIVPFSNMYKKSHSPIEITIPPILVDTSRKFVSYLKQTQGSLKFNILIKLNVFLQRNLNQNNALAIDLGINNLATCVRNTGE